MTAVHTLKIFTILIIFGLTVNSCGNKTTASEAEGINSSTFYSGFSPEFKIYHCQNDSSELHIKIHSSELLYSRLDSKSEFQASLKITGVIRDEEGTFVDSVQVGFSNSESVPKDKILYSKTKFKLPEDENYTLDLKYLDVKRKIKGNRSIGINKTSEFTVENFLVYTAASDFPEFHTHCQANFPIRIYSDRVNLSEVKASYKAAEITLPPPPYSKSSGKIPEFSDFNSVKFTQNSNEVTIQDFQISDIYIHQNEEGLLFLIRPNNFPEVTTASELVMPMRYISSKREYEKMYESGRLKNKIDEFWLDCGTSKDRAKVLINSYYERVNHSNLNFSSVKSGWRTDKGLIYIIYGQPNQIIYEPDSETWVYTGQNSLGSVEFKFNKLENSFSSNHYVLERNPIFKSEWSRRVNAWRNGRIYD